MGTEAVFSEAVREEGLMSSYSVIAYRSRDLPESCRNLVFSKWLRSLRHGNDYFRLTDSHAYFKAYDRYIAKILGEIDTAVRLAVLSDDHDVVLGFSVSRANVLDYVHVHKDHRKMGIGTNLIPKGVDTITHVTRTGMSIWGSKYPRWKFNPFA